MGLGPVPLTNELGYRANQFIGRVEISVAQDASTNNRKPKLDLIQPRTVLRGIVEDEAIVMTPVPVSEEGPLALVAVGVEVIQYYMDPGLPVR